MTPHQVMDKIAEGDQKFVRLYTSLVNHMENPDSAKRMENVLERKIVREFMRNNSGVDYSEAVSILIMDDFFGDLKNIGSKAWNGLRNYVKDNKHTLYPMVNNIAKRIHPTLGAIS